MIREEIKIGNRYRNNKFVVEVYFISPIGERSVYSNVLSTFNGFNTNLNFATIQSMSDFRKNYNKLIKIEEFIYERVTK